MRKISALASVFAVASMATAILANPASAIDPTTAKCAEKESYADFQKCMKDATAKADNAGAADEKKKADAKRECEDRGKEWYGGECHSGK
ncbi:hypothetical protein ACIBCN_44550 [Nocardia sp. NPDC051052]|uniref:hypothetical protein n=1 Tax=Nocardia sp. NPDC051052 TaxID=3364322 RepID=UPI0037899475